MKFPRKQISLTVLLVSITIFTSLPIHVQTAKASPNPSWSFAQITDPHYGYNIEGKQAIHDSVAFINSKVAAYKISFTLVTGDLIHNEVSETQSEQNCQDLKNYLDANLTTTWMTVQGNHDIIDPTGANTSANMYLRYFGDHQTDATKTHYSFINHSYRFIAVGQNEFQDTIGSTELSFIEAELAAANTNSQTPIVIFHEPLDATSSIHEVANPSGVIAVMEAHDGKMLICGHTHNWDYRVVSGSIHQVQAASCGRRWGDPDENAAVVIYNITDSTVIVDHYEIWNSTQQYDPTLLHSFSVDLGEAPPPSGTPDIIVPDDYATIQAAIDAAPEGSFIHIRAGTYPPFDMKKKTLQIEGVQPIGAGPPNFPDSPTIIDGNAGSYMYCNDEYGLIDAGNGQDTDATMTIRYLTLRNSLQGTHSGGILCSKSDHITIEYVNFYDMMGRGVSWRQRTPLCYDNEISYCYFEDIGWGEGWSGAGTAIRCSRANAEISYNWVRQSWTHDNTENGIGIGRLASGVPTPTYSWIHHNLVESAGAIGIHGGTNNMICEYNIVRDSCWKIGYDAGGDSSWNLFIPGMNDANGVTRWNIIDHMWTGRMGGRDRMVGFSGRYPTSADGSHFEYNVVVMMGDLTDAFYNWGDGVITKENYEIQDWNPTTRTGTYIARLGGSHDLGEQMYPDGLPETPWENFAPPSNTYEWSDVPLYVEGTPKNYHTLHITIPDNLSMATHAWITLELYDVETPLEGDLYVNGYGPVGLPETGDQHAESFEIDVPLSYLVSGVNEFTFAYALSYSSWGYEVRALTLTA